MLEKLKALILEHGTEAIHNNDAIAAEHKDAAVEAAASGVAEALQDHSEEHGADTLTDMVKSGDIHADLMDGIHSYVSENLVEKLGIEMEKAEEIAHNLIPGIMSKLSAHTADGFDFKGHLDGMADKAELN
jgi:uncharacterized protein YidB (DUF937 family)